MRIFKTSIAACLLLITSFLFAENDPPKVIGHKHFDTIVYDLYENKISGFLPFDVPFLLIGETSKKVEKIELFYIEKDKINSQLIINNQAAEEKGTIIIDYINNEGKINDDFSLQLRDSIIYSDKKYGDQDWHYTSWTKELEVLNLTGDSDKVDFSLLVDPLKPNREYIFYTRVSYEIMNPELDKRIVKALRKNLSKKVDVLLQNHDYAVRQKIAEGKPYINLYDFLYFSFSSMSIMEYNEATAEYDTLVVETFGENGLFDKSIYPEVAAEIGLYLLKFHNTQPAESSIMKATEKAFPNDKLIGYSTDFLKWKSNSLELEYHAQKLRLEQNNELRNIAFRNKFTELESLMTELNVLEDGETGRFYNVGTYSLDDPKIFMNTPRNIERVSEYDTIISNINELIKKLNDVQIEINSKILTDKFLEICDPEVKDLKNKLSEAKGSTKSQIESELTKKNAYWSNFILEEKERYQRYSLEIKTNILPRLRELKKQKILLIDFWTQILETFYFKISEESELKPSFSHSTTNDFMTRAEYYISGDLGIAAMSFRDINGETGGIRTLQPYMGVNFNLFPINRQAHYSLLSKSIAGRCWGGTVLRGSSIVLGVTTRQVGLDIFGGTGNSHVKGLWEGTELMLLSGFAFRMSDYVRLTLGSSWFRYQQSYSPLTNNQWKLGSAFYFSLSLDLDVKEFAGNVTDLIFPATKSKE